MIFFFIMKSSTIPIITTFPTTIASSPSYSCLVSMGTSTMVFPHLQGDSLREGL